MNIYNPNKIIEQERLKDNLEDFDRFQNLLRHYINENIRNLEMLSDHVEITYNPYRSMTEIYKRLLNHHFYSSYIITDLYKVSNQSHKYY